MAPALIQWPASTVRSSGCSGRGTSGRPIRQCSCCRANGRTITRFSSLRGGRRELWKEAHGYSRDHPEVLPGLSFRRRLCLTFGRAVHRMISIWQYRSASARRDLRSIPCSMQLRSRYRFWADGLPAPAGDWRMASARSVPMRWAHLPFAPSAVMPCEGHYHGSRNWNHSLLLL